MLKCLTTIAWHVKKPQTSVASQYIRIHIHRMCHVCILHKYTTSCALGCHHDHIHVQWHTLSIMWSCVMCERVVVDDGFHTNKPHGVINPGLISLHVSHVALANHVDYLCAHLSRLVAGLASPHRWYCEGYNHHMGLMLISTLPYACSCSKNYGSDKLLNSGCGKPQQWLHHTITHSIVAVRNRSLSMWFALVVVIDVVVLLCCVLLVKRSMVSTHEKHHGTTRIKHRGMTRIRNILEHERRVTVIQSYTWWRHVLRHSHIKSVLHSGF
jgi:hypothetical protein